MEKRHAGQRYGYVLFKLLQEKIICEPISFLFININTHI